jgi:putative ABC transport system permease protein
MWAITLRDLIYRRRQFVIAVLGTAMTFAIALDLTGMSQGFHTEARHAVQDIGADNWLVAGTVHGPFTSIAVIPAATAGEVAKLPGVQRADPLVILPSTVGTGDKVRNVNLIGHVPGGTGTPAPTKGRAARQPGEIVVNDSLGLGVGDHIVVGSRPFEVVGVVTNRTYSAGIPMVFAPISDAEALAFNGQPLATAIVTKGSPAESLPGFRLMSNDDVGADLLRPMANPTKSIDNTRAVMWLVSALIVGAVTYLSVLERLRDFAVFRAVGGSTRSLALTVCLEAVLASTIAAVLAALLANVLKPFFIIPLDITVPAYLTLPLVGIAVGLLASLVGLRRAVRVDPALAFSS